jgi:hypothetical protein
MTKRRTDSTSSKPAQCFVRELAGEIPPTFSLLERLYGLASELYALRPWHLLDESQLVVVPDTAIGETCYCSVMGALGEVLAMHAYIGTESYRLFRKMAAGEIADAGEFFASQHSVYVEFVPRADLDGPDRKLLAALGHLVGRAKASPIFRAIRPGFHPWFVTEEEAQTLEECMRAVIEVCSATSTLADVKYWDQADTYPVVSRLEGLTSEPRYRIELIKTMLPSEPPLPKVQLGEERLRHLRTRDHAVRGVMELDYFLSGAMIGKKSERKACPCIALAVDADSGIVFPPELASPSVSAGDVLAGALLKAIQTGRALPREIRVRSGRFKDCLDPLSEFCGAPIKVVGSLPALEEAREQLLRMMGGTAFPDN